MADDLSIFRGVCLQSFCLYCQEIIGATNNSDDPADQPIPKKLPCSQPRKWTWCWHYMELNKHQLETTQAELVTHHYNNDYFIITCSAILFVLRAVECIFQFVSFMGGTWSVALADSIFAEIGANLNTLCVLPGSKRNQALDTGPPKAELTPYLCTDLQIVLSEITHFNLSFCTVPTYHIYAYKLWPNGHECLVQYYLVHNLNFI